MDKNLKSPPSNHRPIGLFDSGIGGLTVLQELIELLPYENFIYFGDTARLPYGNKSAETIVRYSLENGAFLLERSIKLLVVACHTACAHAYEALQKTLPIPVVGVTQPGIKCLIESTKTQTVAVLGTASAMGPNAIPALLSAANPGLTIHAVACPLFVPLIEEGLHDHPAATLLAEHYLSSLRNTCIDTALLACTHYPLLSPAIQSALGPSVTLIDPAKACADQVRAMLQKENLLNGGPAAPRHHFYTSSNSPLSKTKFYEKIRSRMEIR